MPQQPTGWDSVTHGCRCTSCCVARALEVANRDTTPLDGWARVMNLLMQIDDEPRVTP